MGMGGSVIERSALALGGLTVEGAKGMALPTRAGASQKSDEMSVAMGRDAVIR